MSRLNLYAKPQYKMRPLARIKWWFKRRKYARQRARWGFSEYDVWDMDTYLAELIGEMAKYLAEHNVSHPWDISDEDWKTTLKTISQCFKQYNCERPCPAYEAYQNACVRTTNPDHSVTIDCPDHLLEAWRLESKANYEAQMHDLKRGFDLLYDAWPNLWD